MNHLAYTGRGRATLLVAGSAAALWLGAFGCTAGVKMSVAGTGGSGATVGQGGSGATGGSGTGGRVIVTGSGGGGGDVVVTGDAGPSDAAGCQTSDVMFSPTIPTVFILVDRSGSEFDSGCPNVMTGTYFTLRTAVETVVSQLQMQVRFGLGVFVGDHTTGTCALDWDTVPIALNNSTAINTEYNSLGQVGVASEGSCKADTPAVEAIPMVKTILQGDTAASGPKYVLFATDGQTDFCDDGDPDCPADAITYQVQDLYAAGYGTLVLGLPTDIGGGTAFNSAVLQNLANAGVGQGTALPTQNGTTTQMQLYYACNGNGTAAGSDSWTGLYTAAGHTAAQLTSIATYSTAGTAQVFAPSGTDTQSLITQLSAAINSIPRSCTFDLSTFQIDTTKLNEAQVDLVDTSGNKTVVPLDSSETNGWYMTNITTNSQGTMTSTTLQLFGPACESASQPEHGRHQVQLPLRPRHHHRQAVSRPDSAAIEGAASASSHLAFTSGNDPSYSPTKSCANVADSGIAGGCADPRFGFFASCGEARRCRPTLALPMRDQMAESLRPLRCQRPHPACRSQTRTLSPHR